MNIEDRIIMYLEGEMQDEERAAFEVSLESDPELRKLLDEYKIILSGVEEWGDRQLRDSIRDQSSKWGLSDHPAEVNAVPAQVKKNNNLIYLLAAAVFIGVVCWVFLIPYLKTNSGEKLYAQYYTTDTVWIHSAVNLFMEDGFIPATQEPDTMKMAIEQFLKGDYTSSISLLEDLKGGGSRENWKNYFLGMNYLGLREWEKASGLFELSCHAQDTLLHEQACWQLALIEVRLHSESEKTRSLLRNVIDSNSNYASQAESILKQLK